MGDLRLKIKKSNALLLRPLPLLHPENLVRLVEVHPKNFLTWIHPYNFCGGIASRDPDFAEVICQGEADVAFTDRTSTERIRVHLVSPNFFSSLGVQASRGDRRGVENMTRRTQA